MGRAYEVRKASIMKTGAVKAKLYSIYAREIYQSAKSGGVDPDSNITLRRLIEKAKGDQIPSDIIKRAIDKVNSGVDENYSTVIYEIYGPGGSNLIVTGLTDNVNRTLSDIRPALNKNNGKMGVSGSVMYMYEHLSVVRIKGLDELSLMEALINFDVDADIETEEETTVYGKPEDLFKIKEAIKSIDANIEFLVEEISYLPKEQIELTGDDLKEFNRMIEMLDAVDDVSNIYHNVLL